MDEPLRHILNFISDSANSIMDNFEGKQGFNAEFGSETDIASRFNQGFLVSNNRKLTRRQSFENLIINGPTGSGKTVRLISKILFELKGSSMIVNDPSKELFNLTSGYLSQFFEILVLNFSDSSLSSGYNLLSFVKRANDVNKLAHLLVSATLDKGGSSDKFWSLQSKSVLTIFIRLVLNQPEEFRNMANVLYLLNNFTAGNTDKIDKLVAQANDPQLLLDYKTLISNSEKTLQSILASAKSTLQIFEDSEISKVTSYHSIDFSSIRSKPTILFLHNDVSSMKYINVLVGILFEQAYGYILQNLPKKEELDLFVIAEEASSLYIEILPMALANARKHRVGSLLCVQSPEQLKTFYKDEYKSIMANCRTQIYLPGLTNLEVLNEIQAISGKCIHVDDKGVQRSKPLLTVDEIRLLEEDRSIIISANNRIIKGHTMPYYKSNKYKAYSQIPPIKLKGDIPDEPLKYIPL